MQSIRPEALSNEELIKYARLQHSDGLPKDWTAVVLKRFEACLDRLRDVEDDDFK